MKSLALCMGVALSIAGLFQTARAQTARAADVTGAWTADVSTPDGGSFQLAFTFKQDGSVLTGTVQGPQGEPVPISDGKVEGDKISFKLSFNGTTIMHDGTINASGDEIKLSTKSDSGDFPAHDLMLKRVKDAPAPA